MSDNFLGMRGTGDWGSKVRPKSYREMILFLYPNGDAPLTALLSKMSSESVDDPEFNWWTKTLPTQGGAVTNIYTNVALDSVYTTGGVDGSVVYVKMAAAVAGEIRTGHQVLLRYSDDFTVDCVGKVMSVVKAGDSSYAAVKLLEADDNGQANGKYLSDVNRILIIGNINAEGSGAPPTIAYNPVKYYNYTQIWKTTNSITRTASKTHLRTGSQDKENRRESLELHSIEIEKSIFWGIRTEKTGANGKKERTTWGLIPIITTNSPAANQGNYATDSNYSGQSWLMGGKDWLNAKLAQIFRYGARRKLAYCGYGALQGINDLAETYGTITLTGKIVSYGIEVTEWRTVHGTIYLVNHPLFSYESTNAHSMVIIEPKKLKFRYITDTTYKKNVQANDIDGEINMYLTEAGLEFHHPECFGYLNGVGQDSTV